MIEASLRLPLLCPWMNVLRKRVENIRFLSCRPVFEGPGASAVVMFESDAMVSELESHVSGCPNVSRCVFTKLGKRAGIGIVVSSRCPCRDLGLSENHILGVSLMEGFLVMRLLLPDRRELKYLLGRLRKAGVSFELLRAGRPRKTGLLTPRQEAVLVHAYLGGYFNYPRPEPLTRLAKMMNISASTYGEILRRGIRKAVGMLFEDEIGKRERILRTVSGA
jgi:hypothetical protein